ncbi:uncharacterized protein [Cicer arietinum]|uniref:Zinc finger CCCH domain-containing protein 44-like isoform X2 n=1 Tax=Cicer arietinum TaxID=3827 RepID=A0A3Q7YEI6_CICAR|nr:zinc finger CCCH domain-containing protein 44-like isoform X2 [Cicer arietinum]
MMEEIQFQQQQQKVPIQQLGTPATDGVRVSENSQISVVNAPVADVAGRDDGRCLTVAKRKRGRPPRGVQKTTIAPPPVKRPKDEEDVCFICFDGGSLVLCDHRDCPKAYHPACVKRDDAFFRTTAKWNCGWHLCSDCGKSCHYMCYTCTYSLCKGCSKKGADFVCVRGNKGLCGACMRTIILIENSARGIKCEVDFDDKSSWEYLFKMYWMYLKGKLGLNFDEILRAENPWKGSVHVSRKVQTPKGLIHVKVDNASASENSCIVDSNLPINKKSKGNSRDSVGRNAQDLSTTCKPNGNACIIKNQASPNKSAINDGANAGVVRLGESGVPADNSSLLHSTGTDQPVWLYQDPIGKVHGPYSMSLLCKWKGAGYLPPDLRIWRVDEKRENSILLTDALSWKCSQNVSLPLSREQKSLGASVTLEKKENSQDDLSNATRSELCDNNQTVKLSEEEKVGNICTLSNGKDESVKSNGCHSQSPGLTIQADGDNSDGQSGHFERGEGSPKCELSGHDGPNVNLAPPSAAFEEKLNDKPSDKMMEGHENEQKPEENGNLGSHRFSDGPSSSGQSDQKQSDNEDNSGQSSGQNWRCPDVVRPPMDAPSWLAAIFGETDLSSLVDDSVSDLLEQVEAKEKCGELESPTPIIEWDDDLTDGAITNCFSFANALSPMLDAGKSDALSSSSDLHLSSQSTAAKEPFQQADVHNNQTICGEQSSKTPEDEVRVYFLRYKLESN